MSGDRRCGAPSPFATWPPCLMALDHDGRVHRSNGRSWMLPEHGADANGLAPEGMTKRELAEEVARLRAVPEEVARLRAALEAIKRESERGRYLDIPGMVDGALGE